MTADITIEKKICGANTRAGTPCQGKPMRNGRCRVHGGKTPVGALSGSFKHGRYSRFVPKNLSEMYEASINDPQVLELTDEIALLDSRIADRLQALAENGTTNATWKELQTVWGQFMYAVRIGDAETQSQLVRAIDVIVKQGSSQADIWYELTNLIDNRRKLVDSEGRRLEIKQSIVTVEQAFGLVHAIISAMKEVVYKHADPQTARSILIDASYEHQKLIGVRTDPERSSEPVA